MPGDDVPSSEVADVAVVVVSYHCRDHVLAAMTSLFDSVIAPIRMDVVVVDNGSTDGTVSALARDHPSVQVIELHRNAGFSVANNIGMAATRSRHVLILNPDTIIETGAVERLVEWLDEHPSAGVVAPRLVNPDGTDQLTARAFPTAAAAVFGRRSPVTRLMPNNRWSTKFLTGRDHAGDDPFEIDWVSGAAMMVPRRVIDRVGGFDEGFFLYWEDADWCHRIKSAGYSVWCLPKARVTHDEGGTRDHGWPVEVTRHFHRGAYRYWRKHHAPQPWNPLRWGAAAALTARAAMVSTPRLVTRPTSDHKDAR